MSNELKKRIEDDLKKARKARDRDRTVLLSTTLSEIRNREIERGGDLSEDETIEVLSSAVKRRREASEQMAEAGRPELAEKEEREAVALKEYLPEQLGEEEVREMIREAIHAGADAIGPIMGRIMPRIRGRFDGSVANRIAREELERS